MSKKKKKIILLFDVPTESLTKVDALNLIKTNPDYKDEKDVLAALKKLGHEVTPFAVHSSLSDIITKISAQRCDLVFTMFETFKNDRDQAANLTALFEVMGIPYTGAHPGTLAICKDKGLAKKILKFHNISVPEFAIIRNKADYQQLKSFNYPAIVKPLGLDASEGIDGKSLVSNWTAAKEKIGELKQKFGTPAIVEEYIDGRELYIGILGGNRPEVFPPQELHFKKTPSRIPKILTHRAKWDEKYRKRYGIDSGKPKKISKSLTQDIQTFGKDVASALNLTGYARIDLRITKDEKIFFIEANPNPAIRKGDDFPQSAKEAGLSYDELIASIVAQSSAA